MPADEADPDDHALLTALAQAHEGDFDGHLGHDEVGLAEDGSAETEAGDEGVDDRKLTAGETAQLLQIFEAFVPEVVILSPNTRCEMLTTSDPSFCSMATCLVADESVLDRLPHVETDPSLQSTLRQLLSPSDEGPLRRDVEVCEASQIHAAASAKR